MNLSVQGKILKWQTAMAARGLLGGLVDPPTPTAPSASLAKCDHCHIEHLGGAARCPFKSSKIATGDSRRLSQTVTGTRNTKAWLSRAYKVAKMFLAPTDSDPAVDGTETPKTKDSTSPKKGKAAAKPKEDDTSGN